MMMNIPRKIDLLQFNNQVFFSMQSFDKKKDISEFVTA